MQNTNTIFDLVIIGSGPAGYTGAIRAAQLGMKVAIVEKNYYGGTCLNVGCIPSKSLLSFSKKYSDLTKLADIGINIPNNSKENKTRVDIKKMISKKDDIISELRQGTKYLFKKNNITSFKGNGKIISNEQIIISNKDQEETIISGKKIIIATGSSIITLNGIKIDEQNILSSTGALSMQEIPDEMLVIGGGYIGLELGLVWTRLGTKVTVIEYVDRIVPACDNEISLKLKSYLEEQGVKFLLSHKLESVNEEKNKRLKALIKNITNNQEQYIDTDKILIAVGRKPNTDNLFDENNVNIKQDDYGRIITDKNYQTSVNNIYAVGDVITGPSLAHKAEEEAVCAVERMNKIYSHVNYDLIPSVIYTDPEVAMIGMTEQQLKDKNIDYKVGKFPFAANSMSKACLDNKGFVKILADSKSDQILGAHIIGREAGTMIAQIAAYMEFGGSSEDLYRTCHAHPTLNEAIKEAALDIEKKAINM
ncbi:MAG TPA: dihydrolipoyl dehydrogenase [Candidatus Megaira endosymbiont of Hartmannula sinica]|nr:dihydrolipoyl dehydrogenase [Candidatus Megaera endosymbiont of Hartmannula sinica]